MKSEKRDNKITKAQTKFEQKCTLRVSSSSYTRALSTDIELETQRERHDRCEASNLVP